MASLSITRDEVYGNLALLLSINRDSDEWSAQTLADVERIWRMGVRDFLAAHDWKHLETRHTFVTPEEFDDSTVTVVDGVVTLASGVFPTDAADYLFIPDDGGVYEVASRDSDTQLTLYDTSLDLDAGSEYELHRVKFPLPTNFARFVEPLSIENVQSHQLNELPVLPEWTIRVIGGRQKAIYDKPEAFAVFQDVDSDTNTITPFVNLYPIPDQQYTITGKIAVTIDDMLALDGTDAICHPVFSELLQEAILSAAEKMYLGGQSQIHTQNFAAKLPFFIKKDRMFRGVRTMMPKRSGARQRTDGRFIDSLGYTTEFPFEE